MHAYILSIMKLLSEQVRDLIRASTSSPYAIARAGGIDSTSISRFMNGGNITVSKLDQLAKVLGLVVETEVSFVPRPLEKGRPVKKEKKMSLARLPFELKLDAHSLAKEAYTEHFSSRRGVWNIEDLDCLFIFNNNPFYIDSKARPRELRRIIKRLRNAGIMVLARSSYGEGLVDCNEKYTVGILLDCSTDRMNEVADIVQEEAWRSRSEVTEFALSKKK